MPIIVGEIIRKEQCLIKRTLFGKERDWVEVFAPPGLYVVNPLHRS